MKPSARAEQAILEWLENLKTPTRGGDSDRFSMEVDQLMVHVQTQYSNVTQRHLDKALRRLCRKGKVHKDGGVYYWKVSSNTPSNLEEENDVDEKVIVEDKKQQFLTAAEIMRQTMKKKVAKSDRMIQKKPPSTIARQSTDSAVDIDEEIRRLEEELAAADASDEEKESNIDSLVDDESSTQRRKGTNAQEPDEVPNGIVCLSAVATERIEALPPSCLPANRKRVLKAIDAVTDASSQPNKKKKKKAVDGSQTTNEARELLANEGLAGTIKEILDGYVARSAERLPFYCRVCAKQYNNENEFLDHRQTDVHQTAAELDRKASFCKLCRKQFTSPMQMKEHLTSRPHKERLEKVKSKQPNGANSRPKHEARPRHRVQLQKF